jgi:SAM-dependent methyltransferase
LSESLKQHWENVYETKDPTRVSWHQGVPVKSMALIRSTEIPIEAPVIDVGGGASTLVDILMNSQYSDISVMDISAAALAKAQERLGEAAGSVTWIESEVTAFEPLRRYYLWHDRAVFHFLTDERDVRKYLDVLRTALIPRGHFVLATFGPEGPDRCSGLGVQCYSIEKLTDLLQEDFELRTYELEDHSTPTGTVQQFLYSWWQARE